MKIWFPAVRGNSGTDIFTSRLARALARQGIDVKVSWFPTSYQLFPYLLSNKAAPAGTNVIHANAWNGFAFRRPDVPLIVTEHQGVFGRQHRPYRNCLQALYHLTMVRSYVRASLRAASAVTAVSTYAAQGLRRTLGYELARPIHNFVDCEAFRPTSRERKNDTFTLLFVGNWSYLKGSLLLTEIMRHLGPSFSLRFTSGLKDLPASHIHANMRSIGRLDQEDIITEYQNCDAVIVPSFFEGFGYVALEAMACGRPVIASNNSAFPEIVKDRETGVLCETGSITSFVEACRFLKSNPDAVQRYGDAGRERALALFSERAIIPQYLALYESLTSHG